MGADGCLTTKSKVRVRVVCRELAAAKHTAEAHCQQPPNRAGPLRPR